ncbi:peroxiredoxin family protein [Sedimenticola selenatireducens]|uniref:peroxiredoxin family protein n=1 Tax=Sedimenticola selenatireducens TaxID=191960 RepID=UPI00374A3A7C
MSKLHCLGLILWICYSSVGASEGIERVDPPQDITDFSLAGIDGKQHRFEDFRGKYLLVNFWQSGVRPVVLKCPRYNAPTKN